MSIVVMSCLLWYLDLMNYKCNAGLPNTFPHFSFKKGICNPNLYSNIFCCTSCLWNSRLLAFRSTTIFQNRR